MNKIFFLTTAILLVCSNCGKTTGGTTYTTSASIYLINNTSVAVKSNNILGYVIQPSDTIIHEEFHTNEYYEKPSVDHYDPFATSNSLFFYDNASKCEVGLNKRIMKIEKK